MRSFRKRVMGVVALAAITGGGLVGAVSPLGVSPASAAAVNIRLLNINDFHGRIDANTVRFAATVEQQRAAAPTPGNVLFGAAGDSVGASLFASAVQNDEPTIDVLNALLLNSSSVGNHEFDQGVNDLTGRIEPRANWTYLCANCYQKGTTTPALPEYQVFTIGGVTVGYIGAVTQETPSLVSPSGVASLDFGDPVAGVNRVAAQLSDGNPANGEAQVIVAEYHEGASFSTAPPAAPGYNQPASLAEALAQPTFANIANNTSDVVDVIFNGHTHRPYRFDAPRPSGVGTRPIVQTGQYGEFVGVVDLVVEDTTGLVASYTSALVPRLTVPAGKTATQYDQELAAADPSGRVAQVKTIVDAALANANTIGATPVGSVAADITTAFKAGSYVDGKFTGAIADRDDRSRESTLGHLVADSILASLRSTERGAAEIAVTNPGGLRAELLFAPDGVVTFAEANAVLPFANTLNTITLTGAQLKTLLEQQWQRTPGGTVPSTPYLQLSTSKNFTYTFDPSRPEGDRITSINVNGSPVDPARGYRVGGFSFLLEGGDNFHVFRQGTDKRDSGLIDRDAFVSFLQANPGLAPDFGRRAVHVTPAMPLTAEPGTRLQFTVNELDLRSLGSPQNTELDVYVGGVRIAIVPVSNGTAVVDVTVPADLPTAARNVMLVARPSDTLVNPRTLNAIPPARLFDTRGPGESANALRTVTVGKIGGANELRVKATDLPGLIPGPGAVRAVSINLAVTEPDAAGFVTVYECGTRQLVANINFVRGENVSNAVLAPVSPEGDICFYSLVPTHIVVDVNGWFASGYNAVQPNRVFDTRSGESPSALRVVDKRKLGGDPPLEVRVTDLGENGAVIPSANVEAVSLNVAITNAERAGFISVYPCGERELIANLNFVAGQTVSNAVVVPVSATGTLCFYSPVPTDIVVDVNGWFGKSSTYRGVKPSRVFDTRAGEPGEPLVNVAKTKVTPATPLEVKVTGLSGNAITPGTGVAAVSLNVAVTNPAAAGFVTVYPCGNRPFTANVNFAPGETVSNGVLAPVSSAGTVCFYSLVPTDLVVDINGYFAS